jgi:hypothetical protein
MLNLENVAYLSVILSMLTMSLNQLAPKATMDLLNSRQVSSVKVKYESAYCNLHNSINMAIFF